MKHKCGVVGVFGCKDASKLAYLGLYAIQHRGQEGTGIVSHDGKKFFVVKNKGLVSESYHQKELSYLKGHAAIGHVRYSTSGSNNPNNIQPFYTRTAKGKLAVAHNGNLTNAYTLLKKLRGEGALFQTSVDTEIFLHLISRARGKSIIKNVVDSLKKVEGAFSLTILGDNFLMAARDPYGFRPLVLGKLDDGYIVVSETCALDLIEAEYVREIEPGEVLYIDDEGLQSFYLPKPKNAAMCIFEQVYFARPDSVVFGENVHEVRKEMGRKLADEHAVDADIVIGVPDSGNSAALGYSERSGIPYEIGITRNHYVGRTFIQPSQKIRNFGVKVKLNPIKEVLKGKRVIVVDDSLVRGTTSKKRVDSILKAGAKEVHLRISAPPIISPCYMGIDTPRKEQLIGSQKTIEEIRKYVGADTLGYLSTKGMLECMQTHEASEFCTACFTGKYPFRIKNKGKNRFDQKIQIIEN